MKKIMSLLSASLVPVIFAAGCNPDFENCSKADDKGETICTNPENFKNKLKCEWTSTKANTNEGKCTSKVENPNTENNTPWAATEASTEACGKITEDKKDDCPKVTLTQEKTECKWDDAAKKCNAVEKKN